MTENPAQEAQREIKHWQAVVAKYSGTRNPLDAIQVEEAQKLAAYWQGKLEAAEVETLEDLQFNLIQELKDGGVPRTLWASIADGAEGIEDAAQLRQYIDSQIEIHS